MVPGAGIEPTHRGDSAPRMQALTAFANHIDISGKPIIRDQTSSFSHRMTSRILHPMRYLILGGCLLLAGCSASSPTAPTPPPVVSVPPPAVTPPVVTPPVVVVPPVTVPDPLLSDPRFSLSFYRMFARDGYDNPGNLQPLRRQSEAPRLYLRTVDDAGVAIDALTLNGTAAALESVTGKLTGKFGLAGLERGTDTKEGQRGWVTVRWSDKPDRFCGIGYIGGDLMVLYPKTAGCRCGGGPAIAPLIIKHEMGHVLGFYHTDQRTDLMYPGGLPACDMDPSDREQFAARVAYNQPIGSTDPK